MRITKLSLSGRGAWPDLQIDSLHPHLNVFFARPQAGKSTVAQLVGHLLYGKATSSWRHQFGQTTPPVEGSLGLDGPQGAFMLRRHYDADRKDRLTIAAANGAEVDSRTVHSLLSGLPPQLASRLLAVDFAESPRIDWLLSDELAQQLTSSAATSSSDNGLDQIDRRRVNELVHQRDAIARRLEQQMSVRRRESGVLERELSEVDRKLTTSRGRLEKLQAQLRGVEIQVAELETRLRYLSRDSFPARQIRDETIDRRQREELDAEITRCRQTLADLQTRDSLLRTEIAQQSPDGTADRVTCLADGRATLGGLEQGLDDLETEISQLARANQPGRPLGHDAHARLLPVAAMLRQQVYTLCGQLTEQERAGRRQQLTAESRQLARVQADLGDRLQQLLDRRELLVRQSQPAAEPTRFLPQPPVADHCRCAHHGRFVQEIDVRGPHDADAQAQLDVLHRERTRLVDELTALQLDVDRLEIVWKDLQRERAGLIGGASIDELKAELQRLEGVIQQTLHGSPRAQAQGHAWRASDLLAQLTNGQLVQIRLDRHGREATVVDRTGKRLTIEALSPAQHDQLYVALTLALVGSYAHDKLPLPLILDEPFLRQDPASTAAMAGVLTEFARAGHQLLVFTEDRDARRRFSSDSATVFDLEALRAGEPRTGTFAAVLAPKSVGTRVVRETRDGHTAPALRLASVEGDPSVEDVFYLFVSSSLDEFPVLGGDTGAAFGRIGIKTVGDLLAADPADVARLLARGDISDDTVRLWQKHMGLMCHVPEVTLNDAQLMTAAGIDSPQDLLDADLDDLLRAVEGFLEGDRGHRFAASRQRYNRSRLSDWRRGARRHRERWRTNRPARRNGATDPAREPRPWRFHLGRESAVEDAPSIGPKTAERLAKVGIRSVADLLHADADSTATELDVSHISATRIADWQHQARLVCQIPELRGYGAQLLVASGFTQAEQVARTDASTLVETIRAYCQTKEGQRILRSSDAPSREKIAKWVEYASHRRPLEAA